MSSPSHLDTEINITIQREDQVGKYLLLYVLKGTQLMTAISDFAASDHSNYAKVNYWGGFALDGI